jgi:hypothetical protein
MGKRRRRRNKHHLRPRSRNGSNSQNNLLLIDEDKHAMLHKIFGNRTLGEIIEVLHRLLHLKRYGEEECPICK